MKIITYWDLFIAPLDQNYIDSLIDKYDIDCSQLDITYVFERDEFSTAMLTNAIIHEIMREIIIQNVEDQDDIFMLEENIYTNCIDSHFNVWLNELNSQQAKDLVINFW